MPNITRVLRARRPATAGSIPGRTSVVLARSRATASSALRYEKPGATRQSANLSKTLRRLTTATNELAHSAAVLVHPALHTQADNLHPLADKVIRLAEEAADMQATLHHVIGALNTPVRTTGDED